MSKRIRRNYGWVVWDKKNETLKVSRGMFVYETKLRAWLAAGKERKGSPYKVIRVLLTILKS